MTQLSADRNIKLDFFRGVAILLVIFNHLRLPKLDVTQGLFYKLFNPVIVFLSTFNTGGWVGVDLFFVLSGFLVSGLLFVEYAKEGKINFIRFLIRRGFKLYPSFVFFLVVAFIFSRVFFTDPAFLKAPQTIKYYLYDLLFLHNYRNGAWPHTWSLDVEEHFYFLLCILFFVLIKIKRLTLSWVLTIYVFLLSAGFICRLTAVNRHPVYDFLFQYTRTHCRLDSLFFGVLLSYLYHFKPQPLNSLKKNQLLLLPLCILIISVNFFFNREENYWISVIMLSLNPVCFGIILMIALQSGLTFQRFKAIAFIGRKSYSIYLYHYFVNLCVIYFLNKHLFDWNKPGIWFCYAISYIVLSMGCGITFNIIIEEPFLTMRDRFFPSKSKALAKP